MSGSRILLSLQGARLSFVFSRICRAVFGSMTASLPLDSNTWYRLWEANTGSNTFLGTTGGGSIYLPPTSSGLDSSTAWQILDYNGNSVFRTNSTTPLQISVHYVDNVIESSSTDNEHYRLQLAPANASDTSQQFLITQNDAGYYAILSQWEQASNYALNNNVDGSVYMDNATGDIVTYQGEHWQFQSVAAINDAINFPTTVATGVASTTASATATSSPGTGTTIGTGTAPATVITSISAIAGASSLANIIPTATSTPGANFNVITADPAPGPVLSLGAGIGIGIGGAIVLIMLSLLGFLLWRRRAQRKISPVTGNPDLSPPYLPSYHSGFSNKFSVSESSAPPTPSKNEGIFHEAPGHLETFELPTETWRSMQSGTASRHESISQGSTRHAETVISPI